MMDINSLKYVNDFFGHQEGDNMIKLSYKTISEVFDKEACHYRLGGDEFISILEDTDENSYKSKVNDLNRRLEKISEGLRYNLTIAIGSDVYSDETFEDRVIFLDHIDHIMYEDKKRKKAISTT